MEYLKISSTANPRVKELLAIKNRPLKVHPPFSLVEGLHLLETAMSAGIVLREIFFTSDFAQRGKGQRILKALSKKPVRIYEVSEHIMRKLADTGTPQGVIALVAHTPLTLGDIPVKKNPLFTVIDGIQDPGNLGTIIRTSDAAGADGVILLPGTCDPFSPKVMRSTAGSIFHIPVLQADSASLGKWLRERGIRLAATSPSSGESVFQTRLLGPVALLFGHESRGVGEGLRRSADILVRIPVYGKAESLNVAVAAAICLYEAVRQRTE
jgi:RNA methyltransferase, TrmH family